MPEGSNYEWSSDSTYIKQPPYFETIPDPATFVRDFVGMRVLAVLGDSVTTDHISPAGSIAGDQPSRPVSDKSWGRRGGFQQLWLAARQSRSHGTRHLCQHTAENELVPGVEGSWTRHMPDGEKMFIYDAAMKYKSEDVPLLVIAGKEYGSGSSRDWAAKGTLLLGVRAVIAESFERIHRSNLVQMGVLPLQLMPGETHESLGLSGEESFDISGVAEAIAAGGGAVHVAATDSSGRRIEFDAKTRIDTPQEVEYYRNGGILPYVLRQLMANERTSEIPA